MIMFGYKSDLWTLPSEARSEIWKLQSELNVGGFARVFLLTQSDDEDTS
jgi:hypothetical protein